MQALLERVLLGFSIIILFMTLWTKEIILSFMRKKNTDLNIMTLYASMSAFLGMFGIAEVNSALHHENAILALLIIGFHLMQNKSFKKI